MTHLERIERYPGSLAELATELGNLRYEALAVFLKALADKLNADAGADADRGRAKLAQSLRSAANGVAGAAGDIERAWEISAPFM